VLPPLHLDLPEREAAEEFAGARKKALLRRIGAFLRRHASSKQLLSFDKATEALGPWRQAYLGRRTVPVESIVGSEGRYADFYDEFLPLRGSSEERWSDPHDDHDRLHARDGSPRGQPARLLDLQLHHPRAGVHARDVSRRQEPCARSGTGGRQVTHSALLQPELSGVATFFFGFFMILIVVVGSVLFTYWISKNE
jgi:hypothetical protein